MFHLNKLFNRIYGKNENRAYVLTSAGKLVALLEKAVLQTLFIIIFFFEGIITLGETKISSIRAH